MTKTKNKIKLNREQLLAIYSDGNISVTANAGSGKTAILTRKYVHSVLDLGLDPENIIAITFTKKASAEMRARIKKEFYEILDREKDPIKIRRINTAIADLSKASISTINSLAIRIIDEDPHRIGLAPGFSEINEVELNKFINDSIYSELQNLLQNEDPSIGKLLEHFELSKIISLLSYLVTQGKDQNIISKAEIEELYDKEKENLINKSKLLYQEIIDLLNEVNPPKKNPQIIDEYLETARNILNILNNQPNEYFNEDLKIISPSDKVGSSKISTFITKDTNIDSSDFEKKILESNEYRSLLISENDFLLLELLEILKNISKSILDKVIKYKIESNSLDYSDQLDFANSVLDDKDSLNSFSKKIKLIMVDEFQDTDQKQYEIVTKIWQHTGANLFIVGDEKQSIYGFRNADVRIFKNMKNDIVNKNKDLGHIYDKTDIPDNIFIKRNGEEKQGLITLNTSYRMSKELAFFANSITISLFGSNSEFDVDNTPIQSCINQNSINNPIEFLLHDKSNKEVDEADLVVNKIIELSKDFDLGQICILSRKRTRFGELESRFIKKGIPYQLHSEDNYLNTEEIADIINFLDLLNGNNSKFNQVAILKSYLFGLTDTDILNLNTNNHNDLLESLKSYPDKYFNDISSFIESCFSKVNKISLPELIQDILDKSNWNNIVASHVNSKKILQNIDRFIKEIIEYSQASFRSLNDLVNYLRLMQKATSNSGGEVQIDPDRVNLMTIHGSKGLEFPCVFIYDAHGKLPNNTGPISYSDKYGINLYYSDENDISSLVEKLNKSLEKERSLAEEKRMLYVAMTRASQKLIISSNYSPTKEGILKNNGNTFLQSFYDIFKNLGFDINGNNSNLELLGKINILEEKNIKEEGISLSIPISYDYDELVFSQSKEKPQKQIILNEKLLDSIQYENITASKLNYLNKDIAYFRDRYIYGLPEDYDNFFRGKFHKVDSSEDEVLSSEKGEIIHNILEFIADYRSGNSFDKKKVDQKIIDILTSRNRLSLKDQIHEIIWKVLDSEFILNKVDQLDKLETEKSLKMPFQDDFLTGYIDAIYLDENGHYQIWDWKSNSIKSIKESNDLIKFYEPQLKLYSYFISFMNPKQEVFEAKLLFVKLAGKNIPEADWIHTFHFTRDDLKDFENMLHQSSEMIRSVYFN